MLRRVATGVFVARSRAGLDLQRVGKSVVADEIANKSAAPGGGCARQGALSGAACGRTYPQGVALREPGGQWNGGPWDSRRGLAGSALGAPCWATAAPVASGEQQHSARRQHLCDQVVVGWRNSEAGTGA